MYNATLENSILISKTNLTYGQIQGKTVKSILPKSTSVAKLAQILTKPSLTIYLFTATKKNDVPVI